MKDISPIVNTANRSSLIDAVPLDMPYSLFFDVCNACNFHCKFCAPHTSVLDRQNVGGV